MEPVTPKPDIAPTRPNDMLPSDVHTITPLPYYISSGDQVGFVPTITHACGPAYVHAHFVRSAFRLAVIPSTPLARHFLSGCDRRSVGPSLYRLDHRGHHHWTLRGAPQRRLPDARSQRCRRSCQRRRGSRHRRTSPHERTQSGVLHLIPDAELGVGRPEVTGSEVFIWS